MLSQLIEALVQSRNQAADDVLLEAMGLGNDAEKALALNALLRRATVRGLGGVIGRWDSLPQPIQLTILQSIKLFHPALRECARGRDEASSAAAMKIIAMGRQNRLAYLLLEGLHSGNDHVAQCAAEAMVALARWVATETRRLQRRGMGEADAVATWKAIAEDRGELEHTVARAIDVHRGRHGQELLRAALLLADCNGSRTLAILTTPKHGGQAAMIRRLSQPPDSEHVEAFLLAAAHAGIRQQFGAIFARIDEPPVLDAILRRTHWLKDQALCLCMRQVSRGAWWSETELDKDLARRDSEDSARVGEWIAASGLHEVVQDQLMLRINGRLGDSFAARLRLLRAAMGRPSGTSVELLRGLLSDPDERIARMAAREIVRRKPPDFDTMLIELMASAPDSVRQVIGRSVGQAGFDNYWERFERLDRSTRKVAGRGLFKLMPENLQRLERRLRGGPVEQRLRAAAMVQELELAEPLKGVLLQLCRDANPKVRSKAVALLADIRTLPPDAVLETILNDTDPRVRANAVEVLEAKHRVDFVPLLAQRARTAPNRERANAIKALHRMRVGTASSQLLNMLRDERSEHRMSALWAMRQIGWWQALNEVANIAKADADLRVRRYALNVLRGVAELLKEQAKEPRKAG